jgi:hypothetical protein
MVRRCVSLKNLQAMNPNNELMPPVIPANAGIHFDFAVEAKNEDQNGFLLSQK